jgi:P27 family predicted phage terminase small subunit
MSKRGAKPVPTRLKVLRGTDRPDRRNPHEPTVQAATPRCPAHLGVEAKREWRRAAKHLAAVGLLTQIDRTALALYCDAWGRWVEALHALQTYGLMVKSPNGYPMQSPYLAVANKASEQVRLLLGEFGMTPASRARVHAEPTTAEDDPFELWQHSGRQA